MNKNIKQFIIKNYKPIAIVGLVVIYSAVLLLHDYYLKATKKQQEIAEVEETKLAKERGMKWYIEDSLKRERESVAQKYWHDSMMADPIGRSYLKKKRDKEIADSIRIDHEQRIAESAHRQHQQKVRKIINKVNCSENEAERILAGEIWIGMSYDMLVFERGKPDALNRSNYGDGEQYQACWHDWQPSCFYFKEDERIRSYN